TIAEIGRGRSTLVAASAFAEELSEETPRHARAAIAALERAHASDALTADEPLPGESLCEETRVRLELLLAELLQMKGRLHGETWRPGH
ncbi:MAG: hypothetical protein KGI68_06310, partial [Alphaproteobacteria bacterium]|nr:hypothetical protein [Alphaproteobacteria bacterium]